MLLQPSQPPPPAYYASNVQQVLQQVGQLYQDILPQRLVQFLSQHQSLGRDSARLYARLISRKGAVFRLDKLAYDEISSIAEAIDDLVSQGLAQRQAEVAADRLLKLFTMPEIKACFGQLLQTPSNKSLRKTELLMLIMQSYSDRQIRARLGLHWQWVQLQSNHLLQQALLLFFGNGQQDFSAFIMQDLGLQRYANYSLRGEHRPFATQQDIEVQMHLRQLNYWAHCLPELTEDAATRLARWLVTGCDAAQLKTGPESMLNQRLRYRTLNRLGAWFERRGDLADAAETYQQSAMHPARERHIRLLHKLGEHKQAADLLSQVQQAPQNAAEAEFGRSYDLNRGRSRRAPTATQSLPAHSHCELIEPLQGKTKIHQGFVTSQVWLPNKPSMGIEQFVVQSLAAQGVRAWHSENAFSRGIAGLAYWDLVFMPLAGAFTHPFQLGPLDLFWDNFLQPRQRQWAQLNAELTEPEEFVATLARNAQRHYATSNALVNWQLFTPEFVDEITHSIPATDLLRLANFVMANLAGFRSGFPDLLVLHGPGSYEFIEVKGPNDQLQAGQRSWLKELAQMHIPARVLKLDVGGVD